MFLHKLLQLEKLWENGGQLNDTVAATLVYTFNPGLIIVHVSLFLCVEFTSLIFDMDATRMLLI